MLYNRKRTIKQDRNKQKRQDKTNKSKRQQKRKKRNSFAVIVSRFAEIKNA